MCLLAAVGLLSTRAAAGEDGVDVHMQTTLGAVRDGKRLTPEQLTVLNQICK